MRSRIRELVALRARLGLSQSELGRRVGVDQATVSRWERGLQEPDPRVRVQLSELMYRLDVSRGMRSEIALVEHSPFPMAIISRDWSVIALSDPILLRSRNEARLQNPLRRKKEASADMEQAASILRGHGFFEGKVAAARVVARGFMLWHDQQPFEAVCTSVTIEGEICRLMQYQFLTDSVFLKRRNRFGLVTILSHEPRGAAPEAAEKIRPKRGPAGA